MKDTNGGKPNNFGYKLGYLLGIIMWACLTSIIIAATIKLIIWIL